MVSRKKQKNSNVFYCIEMVQLELTNLKNTTLSSVIARKATKGYNHKVIIDCPPDKSITVMLDDENLMKLRRVLMRAWHAI